MTSLTFRYVALTDVGLRRTNNEDSGYASSRLLAIADGMGGAAAGDLASSTAMNTLRQVDRDLQVDALDALEQTIRTANTRLGELIKSDPAVEGMGTTIEAMLWDGEKLAVAHLGDSRSYRLRDNELTQISVDHTFVQSLVEEGKISPAEARTHPHRSLLLRALLGRDDNRADLSWIQPQLGDRYLLCSDGLSDMVADAAIEQAMRLETIDVVATELVRLALEAGGVDNVTVVLAEFVDADSDPDPDLSSADGQPQLVGAASEQPRPPTAHATTSSTDSTDVEDLDEEAIRYASRPPGRFANLRWLLGLVLLVALIAGAAYGGYRWTQTQYYVAESDGRVAIYQGIPSNVPLVDLNTVDEVTDIDLDTLPAYRRQQVQAGIEAGSRADAASIVDDLSEFVVEPTPTPTPTPTKPTATRPTKTTSAP